MAQVSDYTALLSGTSINGTTGTGAFVSYSFPDSVPDYVRGVYPHDGLATFRPFNEAERSAARAAIQAFATVSGLVFLEVAPQSGDVKFMNFDLAALDSDAAGFAYYPDSGRAFGSGLSSDVFVDDGYGADPHLLLHELGHALGLKHSFEDDPTLAPAFDNFNYTVMSYTGGGVPGTVLGPLDIDAIRAIYGDASRKGAQAAEWSWDAATETLNQIGGEAADRLFGIGGNDIIRAGGGDDTLIGREGANILYGDAGNDTISGGNAVDQLYGGDGDDRLTGGAGSDRLDGGAGNDILSGSGSATLIGGDGNDRLTGGRMLDGGGGNDTLSSSGVTTLSGGDGDDILEGGELRPGTQTEGQRLYGGDGNDRLSFSAGVSRRDYVIDGGAGDDDQAIWSGGSDGMDIYLSQLAMTGIERFTYNGSMSDDSFTVDTAQTGITLNGGGGNDILRLNDLGGTIDGGEGADRVYGGAGDDVLIGGGGGFIVYGVAEPRYGSDELYGGAGNDSFRLAITGLADASSPYRSFVLDGGSGEDSASISLIPIPMAARASILRTKPS